VGDKQMLAIGGEGQTVGAVGDGSDRQGGQGRGVEQAHPVNAQFRNGDQAAVG